MSSRLDIEQHVPVLVSIPYTAAICIAVTSFGPQVVFRVVPCVHPVLGSLHVGCVQCVLGGHGHTSVVPLVPLKLRNNAAHTPHCEEGQILAPQVMQIPEIILDPDSPEMFQSVRTHSLAGHLPTPSPADVHSDLAQVCALRL